VVRMAACFQFQVEQSVPTLGGAIMRYAIALAAAVLIGFGVKLFFFRPPLKRTQAGLKAPA